MKIVQMLKYLIHKIENKCNTQKAAKFQAPEI